jgi:hypothetical protein
MQANTSPGRCFYTQDAWTSAIEGRFNLQRELELGGGGGSAGGGGGRVVIQAASGAITGESLVCFLLGSPPPSSRHCRGMLALAPVPAGPAIVCVYRTSC